MRQPSLTPHHFVNTASIEQLARSILADARFVWETELWLDPIEKAKLDGAKLSADQERVVARELLKASARVDDMLASTIDLYQMYDDAGAATADYDAASKMLASRKPLPFADLWREAEPHLPSFLGERGFPAELYESLMRAAREIGVSFDGAAFTAGKDGISMTGKQPHRILRVPERLFPRVDGDTFVREGLLQTYAFEKDKGPVCTTDSYQALLALAKYASESYRERVREALSSGLKPYKTGVAWFVVVLVIVIIAAVAATVIGVLCATRNASAQFCDISLKILGAVITAGICYLAGEGTDNSFSCGLSSGGNDG